MRLLSSGNGHNYEKKCNVELSNYTAKNGENIKNWDKCTVSATYKMTPPLLCCAISNDQQHDLKQTLFANKTFANMRTRPTSIFSWGLYRYFSFSTADAAIFPLMKP